MAKPAFSIRFAVSDVTGVRCTIRPFEGSVTVWNIDHQILTVSALAALIPFDNLHLTRVCRAVRMNLEVLLFN